MRLTEIALMEAEGNYTRLYFAARTPLILRSLNALEQRIEPRLFFRANRSQIVNLTWIEAVENAIDGHLTLTLRNGRQVEMSRRQSRSLKERMSL